jgi:predicted enzyme related to lactoylglutathione lyase
MRNKITHINIILYVENQELSTNFYSKLLRLEPDLFVPGMTEFNLAENVTLGLMPNKGIVRLLGDKIKNPELAYGIPKAELYFSVDDLHAEYDNAITCGATLLSKIEPRDWGDSACYFADPDGNVIAFAKSAEENL